MNGNKGGRPRKTKGLINVAKWLPQMRRACSRQIVLNQLDELEACHSSNAFSAPDLRDRITQIKKDLANIA